jgi:A/G-specific adenine glycosylase
LPTRSPRTKVRAVEAVAGVVERRGRWLFVQRPPEGLLGGLWELPGGDLLPEEEPAAALSRTLRERLGLAVPGGERVGEIGHVFTHRRLTLHVFRCKPPATGARVRRDGFASHRWIAPGRTGELALGGPTRKALALLGIEA